ncbi:nucleoside-diphosphate sugar epimerase/dehydratase [Bacteriovorax sp. PP10]|uniref:Nucleoside-diphosphate sugar epimerase/dehydratase n=1 Tax=Bacteriovorax antarcticus TaxID=3088717 RepID=A0ABU5VXA0_9BACT|nr:nucleoside-diphosphate sugar epimerase/dehydratase [Bacteriovorax sp. PP10]MEA9356645.1 nucleoside-diphosphate sugar epimerase/dehydratase [Bacteriovorax sp. PP10]
MANLFSNFRNPRVLMAFAYDLLVAGLSFWAALYLRFDTLNIPLVEDLTFNRFFFLAMVIHATSFVLNGLYKGVWRFSSMHDLIRVVKAAAIAIICSLVVCFFMTRLSGVPRSMFLIEFLLLVIGLGGGRFVYRFLKDQTSLRSVIGGSDAEVKTVLIVGAGRAGEKLLRDIYSTPALKINVIGFLDDDKFKKNALIHNVKVFGGVELIPSIVSDYAVDKIFIAIPSANGDDVKRIVNYCKETSAEIKILPKMDQLLSAQVEISLLRNLNIEDLLGREQVQLDTCHLSSMITDKVVLVTGAGGSIGSELCCQIAKFQPGMLIMADYCELFMYELEMKFKEEFPEIPFFPKIIDIRNASKVDTLFAEYKPQLVFHAAAYKHVPMMEYNPMEAVETNIKGTKTVAETALKYAAEKFIMISTDKAVNPTNVMGASKRIAEMVITDISKKSTTTKFISVRFGNVLGSNGSVIPLFRKQIEDRKDITVTHPDIIRYFMSIPEACQLVLQAGSMGEGGEIFVLDMGEPVKIVDLAREMIRLAGMIEGRDINIVFSGLRPGEKLYEELFSDKEAYEFTHHGKIRKALFRTLDDTFHTNLNNLLSLESAEPDTVVYLIKDLVPEFTHFRLKNSSDIEAQQ